MRALALTSACLHWQGADISSFSYYPFEKEKLYGPLVLMQKLNDGVEGGTVKLKMRLNINLHGSTLDEAVSQRKYEIVSRRPYIQQDCSKDWDAIKSALSKDVGRLGLRWEQRANQAETGEEIDTAFDKQREKEETRFAKMFDHFEREDPLWFNDDGQYKKALSDVIDFRRLSISRIMISVLRERREPADSAVGRVCRLNGNAVSWGFQALVRKSFDPRQILARAAHCFGLSATAAAAAIETSDDCDETACESKFPVYEINLAGLKEVKRCMLKELRVGFREEELTEAEELVEEAKKLSLWDIVMGVVSLVCWGPIVLDFVLMVLPVQRFELTGPRFVMYMLLVAFHLFVLPSLGIWIFRREQTTVLYEIHFLFKYGFLWYLGLMPLCSLLFLSTSYPSDATEASVCANSKSFIDARGSECCGWLGYNCSTYDGYSDDEMEAVRQACPQTCGLCDSAHSRKPYFQFTLWSMLLVWEFAYIIGYSMLGYLMLRRVSLIGCVQRILPDLLKFVPLLLVINYWPPFTASVFFLWGSYGLLNSSPVTSWSQFPDSSIHDDFCRQSNLVDQSRPTALLVSSG